jgi:hypothetical protein
LGQKNREEKGQGFTPEEFLKLSNWLTGSGEGETTSDGVESLDNPAELTRQAVLMRALRCTSSALLDELKDEEDSVIKIGIIARDALLTYIGLLSRVIAGISEQAMFLNDLYLAFIGEQLRQVQEQLVDELKTASELESEIMTKLGAEVETLSLKDLGFSSEDDEEEDDDDK